MSHDEPALDPARTVRSDLESFSAAACIRNRLGRIVAANTGARTLWQQENATADLGFVSIRKANGLEWEGWPSLEKCSESPIPPCLLIGRRRDGSEVEYVAFPAVVVDAHGEPAGLLETLFPLSSGTMPLRLIHGLTNALGVILGNVELAKEEMSPEYLDEIRDAALRARDLIRQPGPKVALSENRTAPVRLMCIDDDEAFLLLASRTLGRLGHLASTYSSANEALREFSRHPTDWDLIVIDNNLLGREGLEIAREFLGEDPRARICIASGAVDEMLRIRAEKVGVHRVIRKPGTTEEFAEMIQGILAELTPPPGPP